ncbi:NAD-dependent epimerase/dehydratase family protein [Nocardiopsis sp. RSe5-2]|uniref:NAD-dependent epimerase/dehydratase family protein n=1 Tax=Nocardiopsis endophytica TaxID=3018445 RepID=A0ABT4U1D1_9ACTN|nr:NAD-dependent epimerase/dehydratase family protein [Nocardiopsis endophytica]MDA2810759.1 NAD-dependent epimerase/dehydratase family protein [Nocardiopsis endophytica]
MSRVVIVTGASRYVGARAAEALSADPGVGRVVAMDSAPPGRGLGAAEFVPVRLHDQSVGDVVRETGADTVVHLGFAETPAAGRRRAPGRDVLGTLQLLDACQRSEAVRRLVVRSSAAVGTGPGGADSSEAARIERHTAALSRRRPDLSVAVLRFAGIIGPSVESPLTRYLGLRVVPTVRGYDPRMQFIHQDDGVEAVRRMALADDGDGGAPDGVFDVAAPGSLPLSHCLRRVGRHRFALPERGLKVLRGLARRGEVDYSPERLRQLCCDHVLDPTELERAIGWTPSYTSQEAFETFLATAA